MTGLKARPIQQTKMDYTVQHQYSATIISGFKYIIPSLYTSRCIYTSPCIHIPCIYIPTEAYQIQKPFIFIYVASLSPVISLNTLYERTLQKFVIIKLNSVFSDNVAC